MTCFIILEEMEYCLMSGILIHTMLDYTLYYNEKSNMFSIWDDDMLYYTFKYINL